MNNQPTLDISYSRNLSDEAAYEIAEFLESLSLAFEADYLEQIRRHRRAIYPRRSDLIEPPSRDDTYNRSF